jgi:type I restriction enzyme S subunit
MEVNPGYTQTEVGVIPEEWKVKPLREVAQIRSGIAKNANIAISDPVLVHYLRVANVQDGYLDLLEMSSIEVSRSDLQRFAVLPGDVLMNEGGDRDKLGRGSIWRGEFQPCIHQNHVFVVRCGSHIVPDYLTIWSAGSIARRYFLVAGKQTTNLASINKTALGELPVLVPPLFEQHAIATALSDVDGLLSGLDRLIAKKRDLKQAAMQQLLTGQTRLPGFRGEWDVKRLKQVAEINTGINKPLSEMGRGALYVTVQDLYDKTSIRTERLSRIKVSQSEIETRSLTVGDIVFGKSSVKRDGIGYPSQFLGCGEPVVFSGFTYRARARHGLTNATFLFYALRAEKTRRWLIDNSQASALTNINQNIADAIPVKMPPSLPEQTAIAEVLTEMDLELAGLDLRREKTCALRQAMMQELLTGRTRLV